MYKKKNIYIYIYIYLFLRERERATMSRCTIALPPSEERRGGVARLLGEESGGCIQRHRPPLIYYINYIIYIYNREAGFPA